MKQARKTLRKAIKRKMLDREMSMTALASKVGHDLSVVSKTVNHGRFPRVQKKIREALDV